MIGWLEFTTHMQRIAYKICERCDMCLIATPEEASDPPTRPPCHE